MPRQKGGEEWRVGGGGGDGTESMMEMKRKETHRMAKDKKQQCGT